MLVTPPGSPYVFFIGIDPGSVNLGIGILTVDLNDFSIVSFQAKTINGGKLSNKSQWISETHGDRIARIMAIQDELVYHFKSIKPIKIYSESPFYSSRTPNAFAALTEVVAAIRRAVILFNLWIDLELIDPPTAKKSVGALGNAKKEVMKEKVMEVLGKYYVGSIPMSDLDEHSIDAGAVVYCGFMKFLEEKNLL